MRHRSKALRARTGRGARLVTIMLQTSLILPLGGCFLDGDLPEPALDIPAAYDGASRHAAVAEAALPQARLVALVPFARTDPHRRAGARRQSRHRRGDRPHRAGRRAGAHRRRGAAAGDRSQRQRHRAAAGTSAAAPPAAAPSATSSSASLSASYEIDFWGKNRAALRAAEESAVASRFDREVVGAVHLVTTANAYFQVLAAQDRLRVASDNLNSATDVLKLIKRPRSRPAPPPQLDVAQQESRGRRPSAPPSRRCSRR